MNKLDKTMTNETGEQTTTESVEDKTSENNENQESKADDVETLKAQKTHWRDQAIDPETGKKYKDLYSESLKTKGEDKTSKNETKSETKSDENTDLVKKAFLRSADIVEEDEVELALETANKWDVSLDKLVDDEDFQIKLKKLRTQKANLKATDDVKGDGSKASAKDNPDYWISKGTPPTPEQVPDSKKRVEIVRAMMKNAKTSGKKFYND